MGTEGVNMDDENPREWPKMLQIIYWGHETTYDEKLALYLKGQTLICQHNSFSTLIFASSWVHSTGHFITLS